MRARGLAGSAAALLAAGPLLSSVLRLAPGWIPTGDVAILTVRSQDVLSRHVPLLGMPSTASESGTQVFHPGPLQLWATGLARALWDAPATPLVIALSVGAASIGVALLIAWRTAGLVGVVAAATAFALLGWSLRGEVLASPFNPYAALLPFAAFLVAAVAATDAVRGAGIAAVALGSWAAQAHLAYLGPVIVVALAGAVLSTRRHGWAAVTRRSAWPAWVLLVACWSGPIVDLVANEGGNLRALAGREGGEAMGAVTATEVLVQALGPGPAPARAGAGPLTLLASPSIVSWAVGGLALAGLLAVSIAGRRRWTGAAAAVALAGLGAVTVVLAQVPDLTYNSLALHNYLPLWPLVLLAWLALVGEGLHAVRRRWPRPAPRPEALVAGGLGAAAVLAGLSLLDLHRPTGVAERERAADVIRLLEDELEGHDRLAVHVDPFFEPFGIQTAVLAHLDRGGVDVVVAEDQAAGLGSHRVASGSDPILWISVDHPDAGTEGEVLGRTSFTRDDGSVGSVVAVLLAPAGPAGDGTLTSP